MAKVTQSLGLHCICAQQKQTKLDIESARRQLLKRLTLALSICLLLLSEVRDPGHGTFLGQHATSTFLISLGTSKPMFLSPGAEQDLGSASHSSPPQPFTSRDSESQATASVATAFCFVIALLYKHCFLRKGISETSHFRQPSPSRNRTALNLQCCVGPPKHEHS